MDFFIRTLVKQAHLIWIASIINIGLGFVIPGFDVFSMRISHVALEAPVYAYTHRLADVVIGLSMCFFALGIQLMLLSRVSFSMASILLFGISMVGAGIWTLESPLHELYGLSIFLIIVPLAFSLEFKNIIKSPSFEFFSSALSFLHVFMFWLIYGGFIPSDILGIVQRVWVAPTMGWFGIAAYLLARSFADDNSFKPTLLRELA